MDKLIAVVSAEDVTDEYKTEAKTWTKWDSKTRKRFPYNYTAEERVLVLEGSAELTPDDGSAVVTIQKGDQVTFHKGFKCKWKVVKRMKKHYSIFQEDGDAEAPAIVCDVCEADCFAESYFVEKDEQDICPKCYDKDAKGDKKYAEVEYQKEGEKWVEEKPKKKQKTKQ